MTDRVRQIFERLRQQNPHPTTELLYETPFQLLAAVLLSAQATDVGVNKATRSLFQVAPTPAAMLELGVDGIKQHIRTLGLFNTKADNLYQTCRLLIERHQGEVPDRRELLEALPGVGRKTANVVLNTLWQQPVIAVDTHLFRLANRLQLAPGQTVRAVEEGLMRVIPVEFLQDAHHWLILHGRYVCTARKPHCDACCLRSLCPYPDHKGSA